MSDVVGKERELERQGRLKNDDIDLNQTHKNYDLINDNRSLYRRVNDRVLDLKEQGSRVQKNSVVMYSNVITIPEEMKNEIGSERSKRYFESATRYFQNRFGKENVVSAKVHLDETTPHMHLNFIPVNKEGRLSARTAMNRVAVNDIHEELTSHLRNDGFDITRGNSSENEKMNIKDVHEFKQVSRQFKELEDENIALKQERDELKETYKSLQLSHEQALLSSLRYHEKNYNLEESADLRHKVIPEYAQKHKVQTSVLENELPEEYRNKDKEKPIEQKKRPFYYDYELDL